MSKIELTDVRKLPEEVQKNMLASMAEHYGKNFTINEDCGCIEEEKQQ